LPQNRCGNSFILIARQPQHRLVRCVGVALQGFCKDTPDFDHIVTQQCLEDCKAHAPHIALHRRVEAIADNFPVDRAPHRPAIPAIAPRVSTTFPDDAACAAYLEKAHWGGGFACPHCGVVGEPFRIATRPGVLICRSCRRQTG